MASISAGDISITATAKARSLISNAISALTFGVNFFESPTFESGFSGSRITAATTNGPAYAPRPASSTPTIRTNPFAQRVSSTVELLLLPISFFSYFVVVFVAGFD
ncbi:unannotated protein [freshwater metagenome]|uniref:Unannotated protein n=1 Tax=freshwater metagenome TaxID=449393 RepID=A0A6J6RG88_9ZZZZ